MAKKRTTLKQLQYSQARIIQMITDGNCSVSCAGAIHTDGACHCRCAGLNHGALWIDEIAVAYDRSASV